MLSVISRCVDNEMVFLQKKHGFQLGEEKNLEVRYLSGENKKNSLGQVHYKAQRKCRTT